MLEIATYLKDPYPIVAAKKVLCSIARKRDRIKGKEIRGELQDILGISIIEALIYALIHHRALVVETPGYSIDDYTFLLNYRLILDYMNSEIAAAEILMKSESSLPNPQTVTVEFVATIPPSVISSSKIEGISQIDPSIKRLIASAKEHLWIINPFFDLYGIYSILPALLGAAESGLIFG